MRSVEQRQNSPSARSLNTFTKAAATGFTDIPTRPSWRDIDLSSVLGMVAALAMGLTALYAEGRKVLLGGTAVVVFLILVRYTVLLVENRRLVRDLYAQGKRREAALAVSDDLVDAIAICGPAAHCREKLAEWRRNGMGAALVNLPTGAPFELVEQLLRAIAPS